MYMKVQHHGWPGYRTSSSAQCRCRRSRHASADCKRGSEKRDVCASRSNRGAEGQRDRGDDGPAGQSRIREARPQPLYSA